MAEDKATQATRTSPSVVKAIKGKAEDFETTALVKLDELRSEFAKMINEPVSVKDLGGVALATVGQLGKVIVHYTAAATILLAQAIKGLAQLLLSICYVAAMLVTAAARGTKNAVVSVFTKIYTFASSLVSRNGEATAADGATADQIEASLSTAS